MKLTDILKLEQIKLDFVSTSKEEVINELIDLFKGDERIIDIEAIRKVVMEREEIMSTGVGNGFAIPHGKTNMAKEMVAGFGLLKTPIDFDSIDEKPVNLIFLLIGREEAVGQHIKMLSRISRIMNQENVRKMLSKATSKEDILQILASEDSKYSEIS
jgi:fructose-specific phosphotransferase system IIA component